MVRLQRFVDADEYRGLKTGCVSSERAVLWFFFAAAAADLVVVAAFFYFGCCVYRYDVIICRLK
jgi:hypothetical protein